MAERGNCNVQSGNLHARELAARETMVGYFSTRGRRLRHRIGGVSTSAIGGSSNSSSYAYARPYRLGRRLLVHARVWSSVGSTTLVVPVNPRTAGATAQGIAENVCIVCVSAYGCVCGEGGRKEDTQTEGTVSRKDLCFKLVPLSKSCSCLGEFSDTWHACRLRSIFHYYCTLNILLLLIVLLLI